MGKKKEPTTPIRFRKSTLREILRIGYMGESYNDVIDRILKMNRRGESKFKKPSVISDKMDSSLRKR